MFLAQLVFAFLMGVLFTMIFAFALRRRGPWASVWTFFIIVFLVAWAGSLWITPAGPVFRGIYWVPIVFLSFVAAVLLAYAVPRQYRTKKVETITDAKRDEEGTRVLDTVFWILLVALTITIILGYLV